MIPILPEAIRTKIDAYLKKFPSDQRQSAVLYALKLVQAENGGYLTQDWMATVAAYLRMPLIAVYEVVSFYSLFEEKPQGCYRLSVCTNISCLLRGSEELMAHLKARLKIDENETTSDGVFSLKAVECLAACGEAPAMQINGKYCNNLSIESLDAMLDGLEAEYGKSNDGK